MSEVLVSLIDKTNPYDPAACAMCHKRGDAIAVMPDGHEWSERERANEYWRILRLPLVSESAASALLAPGRATPGSGKLPTRHAFYLDLGSLPNDLGSLDETGFAALLKPRPRPDDPRHIGPDPRVIG